MTEVVKKLLISNPDSSNMIHLCRLCGRYSWNMTSIFDITNKYDYSKVINLHFRDFNISEQDALPFKMCIHCVATVTAWHEYYNSCVDVNRRLKAMKLIPMAIENFQDTDSSSQVEDFILPDISSNDPGMTTLSNTRTSMEPKLFGHEPNSESRLLKPPPLEVDLTMDDDDSVELKHFDEESENAMELNQLDDMKQFDMNFERNDVSFTDDVEVIEIKMNDEDDKDMVANELYDDSSCTEDLFDDIENVRIQDDASLIAAESIVDSAVKDRTLDTEEMAILQNDLNTVVKDPIGDNDVAPSADQKTLESTSNEVKKAKPEPPKAEPTPTGEPAPKKSKAAARNRFRICHLCGKHYNTDSGFRHHMVMHREPRHFCHLCGRVFHESQNLKKHINTIHSEERPFQCHMCGMNYKRRDVLQEHIRRVHEGIKKWGADMIKKYHQRGGSGKPNPKGRYQCPHCNKCMASKAYLKDHINGEHIKEKIYKCKECDMSFCRAASYRYHYKRAHIEKKQVLEPRGTFLKDCEYCGLQFRVQKYYEKHIAAKHFNKYPCEHCDQVFDNKPHLTRHTETEHADKLSRCEECGKCFAEEVHVKRHIYLVHSKRVPHECYHCGYKANKKSTLTVHMRKHTGEKPYQCDICQRCFSQSVDYRKHRTNHFKSKAEERGIRVKEADLGFIIQTLDVAPDLPDERNGIHFAAVDADIHP